MSTKYTYSKTNDFPNEEINLENLENEIKGSEITITLSYITVEEDDCNIIFESDLLAGEEGVLDNIISNHDNTPSTDIISPIFVGNNPDIGSKFWMNPVGNIVYSYDEVRDVWLSTNRSLYSFARKGNASGMYIPLLGDLDALDDVYMPGKDSVMVNIFCRSSSGQEGKEFEIRKNGETIHTFSYVDSSLTYSNSDLNLNVDANDKIQVFVKKIGGNVINTLCRIEIAWRYNNE